MIAHLNEGNETSEQIGPTRILVCSFSQLKDMPVTQQDHTKVRSAATQVHILHESFRLTFRPFEHSNVNLLNILECCFTACTLSSSKPRHAGSPLDQRQGFTCILRSCRSQFCDSTRRLTRLVRRGRERRLASRRRLKACIDSDRANRSAIDVNRICAECFKHVG